MLTVAFIILAVFSVLIWAEAFKHFLTPKMANYSFVLAIGAKTILLYELIQIFGYTNSQIAIYFISILLFKEFKLYEKKNLTAMFGQNKFFLAFAFIWLAITFQGKIIYNDEFFWATFVKHLFLFNHYWTAESFLVNGHYMPGIPLWQKFFVGTEFVNEQLRYMLWV